MGIIPKRKLNQSGFTLIELLIVIGILAILLAITLLALNPTKHFQGARNAQRSSDVTAILDSIYEYEAAHSGSLPPSVAGVSTSTPLGGHSTLTPTNTTFSTPNLTFTGLTGNTITSGSITVSLCANAGNNGTFTVGSGTATTIVVSNLSGVAGDTSCSISGWTGVVNICPDVVPTYLANIPMDPGFGTGTACQNTYDTGYTIAATSGRFTISAPHAEDSATISVTR